MSALFPAMDARMREAGTGSVKCAGREYGTLRKRAHDK